MKEINPNKYNVTESGNVIKSGPELIGGECEHDTFSMIKYDGHEYETYKDGVKYKSTDGKNWVPETEHHPVLAEHEYTKIQNYIEAIRLIAEKVGTAESDCIEQLARDVGSYLYDLVKGDKDD